MNNESELYIMENLFMLKTLTKKGKDRYFKLLMKMNNLNKQGGKNGKNRYMGRIR